MIKNNKRISYNNKGSAIITALVVSTVVMVLCLSLLAVAYSLFLSQKESTSDMSDRELLYSAIELMEEEITNATWHEELGTSDGESEFGVQILNDIYNGFTTDPNNTAYMIQNSDNVWLYYDPNASITDPHHDLEKCSRYFNIRSIGSVKIVVQMYWMLPELSSTDGRWDGKAENREGSVLHAIYRLYNNDMEVKVKVERAYKLAHTGTTVDEQLSGTGSTASGEYKIVFKSIKNVNSIFLPDPIYFEQDAFDNRSLIPNITEKIMNHDIWYSWYTDSNCTSLYNKNNITEADFKIINGQKTLELYTNWDNKLPHRLRFLNALSADPKSKEAVCIKIIDVPDRDTINISEAPTAVDPVGSDFVSWKILAGGQFSDYFGNDNLSHAVKSDTLVYAIYDRYYNPSGKLPKGNVPGHNGVYIDYVGGGGGTTTTVFMDFSWIRLNKHIE